MMDAYRWRAFALTALIVTVPLRLHAQEPVEEQADPFADDVAAEPAEAPTPEPEPEPEPPPVAEPEPEPAAAATSADASASGQVSLGGEAAFDADATSEGAAAGPAEAGSAGGDEEEIFVTGSRIKRNSFDTPTPVQVINRDEITKSGASNMADLIRFMTANTGSATQFGLGQGSAGSANFNLRGLGLANTLVLLNGRRLTPYPDGFGVSNGASFSDVNQIPLNFIERIEIAKGGASAIYGSDAIAGVINIILRKDFEGAQLSWTGFSTDKFDQQDQEFAAIFGANSDDSSVVAQFSYFKRYPLPAKERDYTDGTLTSTVGFPGTYILLGPDRTPVGALPDPACGTEGTDSSINDMGRCVFDYRKDWNLFNEEERILAYTTAEHRPSDAFQLFAEAGFARKESIIPQSPSYPLLRSVIVPANHPDWPGEFREMQPDAIAAVFLGRPFGRAAGTSLQTITLDGYRAVGGVKGDLDEVGMDGWSWEAAFTWHMNEFYRRNEDILFDKFQAAVNSCTDPTNLSGCYNTFYSGVDGTGTINSAEVVDRISGQFKNQNTTILKVGDLNIAGPLFPLPGGDMAIALGAQIRETSQMLDYDNDAEEQAYAFVIGDEDWEGSQSVYAAYAELSLPFAQGLEVQAAARVEAYKDLDTSVNPRVGFSWVLGETFQMPSVLERFRLRGSIGTAFRAPNLLQTNGAVTNLEQFNLPTGPVFRGARTLPNPDLEPEKSLAFSVGFEWIVDTFLADLDYWQYNVTDLIIRESAQAYVAGVLQTSMDMGTPLSMTPGNENINFTPGTDNIESVNITYNNQDEITTNGIDLMLRYSLGLGSGGDLNFGLGGTYVLSYMIPATAVPNLSLADGSTPEQDGCDGDECDIAGKRNVNNFSYPIPRIRARVPIGWTLSGHYVNLGINYIGSYDDDANFDPDTGELTSIDAWVTLDLSYGYIIGETPVGSSTEFRLGLNNLLGTEPPEVENTNFGYDIFTHDPRGRILYANLTHKF